MAISSPSVVQMEDISVLPGAIPRASLDVSARELSARGIEWRRMHEADASLFAVVRAAQDAPAIGLETDAEPDEPGVYVMVAPEIAEEEIVRLLDVLEVEPEKAVDPVSGRFIASAALPRADLVRKAVEARPGMTVRELADAIGVSASGSFYELLNRLVDAGELRKQGPHLEPRPGRRHARKASRLAPKPS